jgi:HTH-type transcriptional regulator/antitoxin HigA
MTVVEPLRTESDYDQALGEIEAYFENVPAPGTEGGAPFELLATLINEYEDANFPTPGE